MTPFAPAKNQVGCLKCGILGFQGAGKTYLAVDIALGLIKLTKATKPLYFIDTEHGSDWAIPRCDQAGVPLKTWKTRAFKDLITAQHIAERESSLLIIDSITHFWNELVVAYKKSHNLGKRVPWYHWGPIKEEWAQFSEWFVNVPLHIIVCGRAGYTYDEQEDQEGQKELLKTGTRMKVEGEFGYEPALLIELERERASGEVGARIVRRAYVIKDRRMDKDTLDGKVFDNASFKDFLPHIQALNLGGEHLGFDATSHSEDVLVSDDSRSEYIRMRTIALEEIEEECKTLWPGRTAKEQAIKGAVMEALFGTKSWTAIKGLAVPQLQDAVWRLRRLSTVEGLDLVDTEAVCQALNAPKPSDKTLASEVGDFFAGQPAEALGVAPSDVPPEPERKETAAPDSSRVEPDEATPTTPPEDPVEAERKALLAKIAKLKAKAPESYAEALSLANVNEDSLAHTDPALLAEIGDHIARYVKGKKAKA